MIGKQEKYNTGISETKFVNAYGSYFNQAQYFELESAKLGAWLQMDK